MSEDDDKKLPAIQNRLISATVEIDQDDPLGIVYPRSRPAGRVFERAKRNSPPNFAGSGGGSTPWAARRSGRSGWTIEAPAGLVAMAGPGSPGRHAPSAGRPGGRQPAASRPVAAAEPYHLLRIMDNYVITHEMMIQGGQRG